MPIKGKSKTAEKKTCRLFTKNSPTIGRRTWTDVEPREIFFLRYQVSKKVTLSSSSIHNMCIEKKMEQSISGESKKIFRISSHTLLIGFDSKWKKSMAGAGGDKRRFQYCTDASGTIVLFPSSSGTLRTQSYWSFFTRQCGNSEQLLPVHLPCRMCFQFAFCHQFGINTWRVKVRAKDRQYSFCLLIRWSLESWYDQLECTASCTIHA